MTAFAVNPETLKDTLAAVLGDKAKSIGVSLGEVNVVVHAKDYLDAALLLRDAPACQFEQLIDLCGVDYSEYKDGAYDGLRYCVVSQLLSVTLNQRIRLKVFATNDDMPIVASLGDV